MNKKFWIKKIVGCIVIALVIATVLGFVVMQRWNHVLTSVVQVPLIDFWQALGLLILSKILFGGIRGKWGGSGDCRGGWKSEMREKWRNMSAEEREKLKQEWRDRCRKF